NPNAWALAARSAGSASVPVAKGFDGKSFADLLTDASNAVWSTGGATLTWSDSNCQQGGKVHAELRLLAQTLSASTPPTWTFVARKTVSSTVTYRALTAAVPLYAWQFNRIATGHGGELSPILSYNFVRGGRLGRIARQSWTVQENNPSRPKYDGFGLPFTWV